MTTYTSKDYKGETHVVIPDSVTHIENGAFFHCTSLKDVKIPNSVTDIGNRAFYHCTSLLRTNRPELYYPDSPHLNKLERYPKDLTWWSPELAPVYFPKGVFLVLPEFLPNELVFLVLGYT